jgi:hypothetical protein
MGRSTKKTKSTPSKYTPPKKGKAACLYPEEGYVVSDKIVKVALAQNLCLFYALYNSLRTCAERCRFAAGSPPSLPHLRFVEWANRPIFTRNGRKKDTAKRGFDELDMLHYLALLLREKRIVRYTWKHLDIRRQGNLHAVFRGSDDLVFDCRKWVFWAHSGTDVTRTKLRKFLNNVHTHIKPVRNRLLHAQYLMGQQIVAFETQITSLTASHAVCLGMSDGALYAYNNAKVKCGKISCVPDIAKYMTSYQHVFAFEIEI